MLLRTGWWPTGIDFDIKDLHTVDAIVKEQAKNAR